MTEPNGLDDELRELLAAEKSLAAPPSDAQGRVLRAVEMRAALVGAAPHTSVRGLMVRHPLAAIGTAFVAGGLVGGVVTIHLAPPATAVTAATSEESPANAPVLVPPAPVASASATLSASTPAQEAASAGMATVRPASTPDAHGLRAERALLDTARAALSRGEPDRALEATERHAKEFPHGLLAEEREALAIHALVASGREDAARTRTARFRAAYPKSLLQPAIDREIDATIP